MLGSTVFNQFSSQTQHQVWGTLRNEPDLDYFSKNQHAHLLSNIDVLEQDSLISVLSKVQPDVVINCIGLIKQLSQAGDPISALQLNSILPHRLAKLCSLANARLIHISTDCVFNGRQGMYTEKDVSNAEDLYGKSKYLGEINDSLNVVTLRTSIIGHELKGHTSLVAWFLSQTSSVKGYKKAVFSGVTTIELATLIKDYVIPDEDLYGLYHVSAEPIDKYSLLKKIADVYDKDIDIIPDEKIQIDRSLDSVKFQKETGYQAPAWLEMIEKMHNLRLGR